MAEGSIASGVASDAALSSSSLGTCGIVGPSSVIRHFYSSRDLELWSCVEEFHRHCKFQNYLDWKTYKEPLKVLILLVESRIKGIFFNMHF